MRGVDGGALALKAFSSCLDQIVLSVSCRMSQPKSPSPCCHIAVSLYDIVEQHH